MSNLNDLKKLMPEITAIGQDEIKPLNMPVGIYQQEGEDLHYVAMKDMAQLAARGLNPELIESLKPRAGALSEAQSIWAERLNKQKESIEKWKVWAPKAIEFREDMLDEFEYAYRNHEDLLKAIITISEGDSNADLVQDLNDIAVLGRKNPEPLNATNFDMQWLQKAAELSDVGSEILAAANGDRNDENEERVLRDKAYTYLKQAIDEVRACGKFVFRSNPKKLEDYRSSFLRNKNLRNRRNEKAF